MRVLELFSGIGGMHFALKESGAPASVAAAIEINPIANIVYKHNFPETCLLQRNIQSFSVEEINKISPDIILMSPPCQPFTRVGLKKDLEDFRTCAFLYLLEMIPQLNENLRYILVENVKGFDTSNSRQKLLECLQESHFIYQEFILSPRQFSIPNSRTRYYLIAKRKPLKFCFPIQSNIVTDLSDIDIQMDGGKCNPMSSILELEDDFESSSYKELLVPDKILKRLNVMDVVTKDESRSCCFTKAYGNYVEGTGSVYSPFPISSVENVKRTMEEQNPRDEQFLEAVNSLKLRFFSPTEISRLMCFPDSDFNFPETLTVRQKYKLLGNSINVKVVAYLIRLMVLSV